MSKDDQPKETTSFATLSLNKYLGNRSQTGIATAL
jgi:hypothetical protein